MPPPPEFGDAPGDIGPLEILVKVEAEHAAKADGHVGVAGEVAVNLQRIAHRPQPREGGGGGVSGKGCVGHGGQLVGQQHLFGKADEEPVDAFGEVRPVFLPVEQLVGHRLVLDDGPRHQLGEKGDVQAGVQRVFLHLRVPPGHVEDIAHGLKGEEGDADGQRDAHCGQGNAQILQHGHGKAKIFEHEQQREVADHRQRHRRADAAAPFPGTAGPEAQQVVHQDGNHHEQQGAARAPAVEKQGGQQQEEILSQPPPPQGQVVHQQHRGQKREQEHGAGKQHGGASFLGQWAAARNSAPPFFSSPHYKARASPLQPPFGGTLPKDGKMSPGHAGGHFLIHIFSSLGR